MQTCGADCAKKREELFGFIDGKREEMLAFWKELVNHEGRYDEVENLREVAAFLKKGFEEAGFKCELVETGSEFAPVLTGVLGAERKGAPVLFTGHYDTVFKKGTYGENPFHIENGRAYGPGVLDMKGGIAISLLCAMALNHVGFDARPIRISYAGDEEGDRTVAPNNTVNLLNESSKGCIFAFNMETGVADGGVCIGRKGAADYVVTVKGVAAHPGNAFAKGRNAIEEMAHKILEIQRLTPEDLSYTVSVDLVEGGVSSNTIPDRCQIRIDTRANTNKDAARIKESIENICAKTYIEGTSTEVTQEGTFPPYETTDGVMKLYGHLVASAEKYGLAVPSKSHLGGASDASRIDAPVLCSCGVPGSGNHTSSEYADVEGFFERAKLLCAAILEADSFAEA